MGKLIDKDKIVAYIESQIDSLERNSGCSGIFGETQMAVYDKLYSFLDTLEVKEVNLEREIGLFATKELLKKRNHSTGVYHFTQNDIDNIAKHFFELGLGVQTPVFIYKPSPQNLASELGLKAQKGE